MNFFGIIPSRYASTRLPGKPLLIINKKSMIERVYTQVTKCVLLKEICVATDDHKIILEVLKFNGNAILTSESHTTGTERCLETAEKLSISNQDIVINIQGDEPFIDPANIEKLISIFKKNPDVKIATLVCKIKKEDELFNPNCPKVILDNSGKAVYFSRTTIPFVRDFPEENWITKNTFYKHIGIYAYRKDVLNSIVNLPQSTWEKAESLEQLRWLQNGFEIFVAEVEESGISVDTEADLIKANDFAVKNQL
ncbi:MAG: 3-deoxy-manno-octulosonate cytidylyltransferase [Bacteroidota bacterium]|jgi:3-deoxy-manno-octulosonate cytidylyltransferase (CMP-KDO synthetase)